MQTASGRNVEKSESAQGTHRHECLAEMNLLRGSCGSGGVDNTIVLPILPLPDKKLVGNDFQSRFKN